jgi:hypothetical protein
MVSHLVVSSVEVDSNDSMYGICFPIDIGMSMNIPKHSNLIIFGNYFCFVSSSFLLLFNDN